MKVWLVVVFALTVFSSLCVNAKDEQLYAVSEIPEEMKTGMYAVIREKELRFEINSEKNATTFGRLVITILNSNGAEGAEMTLQYDKFIVIKSFKGTAYDAAGKVIKRLKPSEIYDQSVYDGGTLFSDDRFKKADLTQGTYPYTVEFEYEIEYKALFHIPSFLLYYDDEISIQMSKYSLIYPPTLKPRYKLFEIPEPTVSSVNGKEKLEWGFKNFKPQKFEKLSPSIKKVVPNISVAPTAFEFDKYAGRMDTWENFSKWILLLNNERDILPEQTRKHVQELTRNASTTEEKVKILYEYLQSKTRYVGIQLGIGGYQPFDAAIVDKTGYGDCKALSNYMVSLLKEVGITSYYTLIRAGAGEAEIDITFPSSQFNHVVVAVPNKSDTIWLECTSQTKPMGYAGEFTGDRSALMITQTGGKIVKTPRYTADQNLQLRSADVFMELTGDARAKVRTIYKGLKYEDGELDVVVNQQHDDQKKWIQKNVKIPVFEVTAFRMTNKKAILPSAIVDVDLALNRFGNASGKRIFITPNLMNRSTFSPEKLEARKTNVVIRRPFTDFDTVRYHLPEGIFPEFLPEPILVKSRFGEYNASCTMTDGMLIYVRKLKINKGEFPRESYTELTEFFKSVNKNDNLKIVFMSKT